MATATAAENADPQHSSSSSSSSSSSEKNKKKTKAATTTPPKRKASSLGGLPSSSSSSAKKRAKGGKKAKQAREGDDDDEERVLPQRHVTVEGLLRRKDRAFDELLAKYRALQQGQHDEVEQRLAELETAKASERDSSEDQKRISELTSELRATKEALAQSNRGYAQITRTYELLTGMRIRAKKGDEAVCTCKATNPNDESHFVEFTVRLSADGVDYDPQRVELDGVANVPDYLREAIEFKLDEAPRFTRKLLEVVNK